ncbi:MAG: gamma-glutamyl-gamma-aminobutyrate hydrolase family protein [Spirochaetaceae bacterium]|nr:MAG: gamma-glutamyl-gamma-aminobutyrate hydrolase family protein [Spirochaetaceae bacterium]
MKARPAIAITSSRFPLSPGYFAIAIPVWLGGGRPRRISLRSAPDPDTIDGLIVAGGADVAPDLYGYQPAPRKRYNRVRDLNEIWWVEHARERGIPVLGICRGAQLMNVAAGGTLHQAVRTAYRNARYPHHPIAHLTFRKRVFVDANSVFGRLVGRPELMVNSLHKQAIDRIGRGLKVTAREQNGVVQTIEDVQHGFCIGVQFHPELLIYRAVFRRLFRALIACALRLHSSRSRSTISVEATMKVSRNDPCPCGSGKKYKHCCYARDMEQRAQAAEAEAAKAAEEAAQAGPEADEAEPDADGAADDARRRDHQKDRSRFQGDNRGKSSSFRPRATRGAQRGS